MPTPNVPSWIEEPSTFTSLWIDAREIGAFVVVVGEANQREVACDGRTVMLLRDDVIDLKRQFVEHLRHLAILAAVSRSLPNQIDERLSHDEVRTFDSVAAVLGGLSTSKPKGWPPRVRSHPSADPRR